DEATDEDYTSVPVACPDCLASPGTSCLNGRVVEIPCAPVEDGVVCDGGQCALAASCLGGSCTVTRAVSCDDGDPCTADFCDDAIGCTSAPAELGTACEDGDLCTHADRCVNGACVGVPATCGAPGE